MKETPVSFVERAGERLQDKDGELGIISSKWEYLGNTPKEDAFALESIGEHLRKIEEMHSSPPSISKEGTALDDIEGELISCLTENTNSRSYDEQQYDNLERYGSSADFMLLALLESSTEDSNFEAQIKKGQMPEQIVDERVGDLLNANPEIAAKSQEYLSNLILGNTRESEVQTKSKILQYLMNSGDSFKGVRDLVSAKVLWEDTISSLKTDAISTPNAREAKIQMLRVLNAEIMHITSSLNAVVSILANGINERSVTFDYTQPIFQTLNGYLSVSDCRNLLENDVRNISRSRTYQDSLSKGPLDTIVEGMIDNVRKDNFPNAPALKSNIIKL